MKEASKAMRRRFIEHHTGGFQWMDLFVGEGLDVGCGDDKLPFVGCHGFDRVDGDANDLTRYFTTGTFDYLHSSQSLEHMVDPAKALTSWIKVTKPGGHLIATIPCWELYEQMIFPSRWNPDHKSTWSLWQKDSNALTHVHVPTWLEQFTDTTPLLVRLVDNNYDYAVMATRDQTLPEDDGVEAFIEFILMKKPNPKSK